MSKYYDCIPHIYEEVNFETIHEITPPKDLSDQIKKLEKVIRFKDKVFDGEILVPDTTMHHTYRLVHRAKHLPLNNEVLERILWVHDIVEVIVDDVSAVEKENNNSLTKKVEIDEELAARALLSKEDYLLFRDTETAKNFLSSRSNNLPTYQEAFTAKIIDHIDGNLVFHHYISNMALLSPLPKVRALEDAYPYTFKHYSISKEKLENSVGLITENIYACCLELLEKQINKVVELWSKVPDQNIPDLMKKFL